MLAFTAAMALIANPKAGVGQTASLSDSFVANGGQWDSRARFMARSRGANLWVTDDGYVIDFSRTVDGRHQGHVVRVSLEGAGHARVEGLQPREGKINYLVGGKSSVGIARYAEAKATNALPGVDERYYFEAGRPRYDLILRPGANPDAIKLNYAGATHVRVGADGVLRYDTSLGTVEERGLFAYQQVGSAKVPVAAKPVVNAEGKVTFALGAYDKTKSVVIDPIVWATYSGGTAMDAAQKVALDANGNVVVLGTTASTDFPTTTGAYDVSQNGLKDVVVSRYSADGTTLQFATYYGGTSDDTAASLTTTGNGNIVFAGTTNSTDLPRTGGQIVAGYRGGTDGFIAILDGAAGAFLRTSSYIGGSADDSVAGIALDGGNLFFTGTTASTNFPIVGASGGERSGIQRSKLAGTDAFFGKVDVGSGNLLFSTYIGSAGNDTGVDVQPLGGGKAAVLGNTNGTNLLTTWKSKPGFQKDYAGGASDAFLIGVSADGLSVDFRTYLGGTGNDVATALTGDSTGVVAVGSTDSSNFPVANGYNSTYNGPSAFVTKVNPDGAAYAYSFFYGTQRTTGSAFADDVTLDVTGGPILVGHTDSDFLGYQGAGAIIRRTGGWDTYIARFAATGKSRWYATYLGGTGDETGAGVAISSAGAAYVVSNTTSSDFPVTSGVPQGAYGGAGDGTLTDFNLPVSLVSFTTGAAIEAAYRQRFTLTFDGAAYASTPISLVSDTPAIEVPPTFNVARGVRAATIFTNIGPLFDDTPFNITATVGGGTFSTSGTLRAPDITVPTFPASSTVGGSIVNGTVGVTAASGLRVPLALKLVDGDGNDVPASVATIGTATVQPNQASTSFRVTTSPVSTDTTVYLLGAKGVKSDAFTILAPRPMSLSLSRASVYAPATLTATLTLTGRAPDGGLVVTLGSSDPSATVPPTVTVPAGTSKITFHVDATPPDVAKVITITAIANGTTSMASFTSNVH